VKARRDVSHARISARELVENRASHAFGELSRTRKFRKRLFGVAENDIVKRRLGARQFGVEPDRIELETGEWRTELDGSRFEDLLVLAHVGRRRVREEDAQA